MKRIEIDLKRYTGTLIYLGKVGEHLARELVFDCEVFAKQYGGGTGLLLAIRPDDSLLYPCATVQEKNKLIWQVTGADTAKAGGGALVLRWYVGESLAKSRIIPTRVDDTPDITGEEAPDAYQGWIEQVLAAGVTATEMAQSAGVSAEASAASASESERQANLSADSANASERSAQASATSASESEGSAVRAKTSEENAEKSEMAAKKSEDAAVDSERASKESENQASVSELHAKELADVAEVSAGRAKQSETNADVSEQNAHTSAFNAQASAKAAEDSAGRAYSSEQAARESEINAKASEINAQSSESTASQALADLLHMLGTDVATLVNGKIPVSQIPSIATVEIYHAASLDEMNTLEVQRGDVCIRTDEDKSYIYSDGWVHLASPTDYASRSGYSDTAGVAENANTIGGYRLVQIPWSAWESTIKDPDTYYLVYTEETE